MTSCSRQNASTRTSSSRLYVTSSSAAGWSAAIASSTPRTSAPSSSGAGSPGRHVGQRVARDADHLGTHGRELGLRPREDRRRRDLRVAQRVAQLLGEQRLAERRARRSRAGATSSARCRPMPSSAAAAVVRRGPQARQQRRDHAGRPGAAASAGLHRLPPRSATPPIRCAGDLGVELRDRPVRQAADDGARVGRRSSGSPPAARRPTPAGRGAARTRGRAAGAAPPPRR